MFGPGEYVPDPTEGITDVKNLPPSQTVAYSRNQPQTPCPRCGHLAYRHKSGQRTLHDLGDLSTGCPVDLLVSYLRTTARSAASTSISISAMWRRPVVTTPIG